MAGTDTRRRDKESQCPHVGPNGTLKCDLPDNHGPEGMHHDPERDMTWKHPRQPYGGRRTRGHNDPS